MSDTTLLTFYEIEGSLRPTNNKYAMIHTLYEKHTFAPGIVTLPTSITKMLCAKIEFEIATDPNFD